MPDFWGFCGFEGPQGSAKSFFFLDFQWSPVVYIKNNPHILKDGTARTNFDMSISIFDFFFTDFVCQIWGILAPGGLGPFGGFGLFEGIWHFFGGVGTCGSI